MYKTIHEIVSEICKHRVSALVSLVRFQLHSNRFICLFVFYNNTDKKMFSSILVASINVQKTGWLPC